MKSKKPTKDNCLCKKCKDRKICVVYKNLLRVSKAFKGLVGLKLTRRSNE